MYLAKMIAAASDCIKILEDAGETFWVERMKRLVDKKSDLSERNIEEVYNWFGGMGSLNDVCLCRENGHSVKPKDKNRINSKFHDRLGQIFESAYALLREIKLDRVRRKIEDE